MLMKNIKKILLLSGGADSMYINQIHDFDLRVFFDYGQKHLKKEYNICEKYIDRVIKIDPFYIKEKEVSNRNLTFISTIVSVFGDSDLHIYLGSNYNDIYKDNQREYFDLLEKTINVASINKVKIITPLINIEKKEILKQINLKYYSDL